MGAPILVPLPCFEKGEGGGLRLGGLEAALVGRVGGDAKDELPGLVTG
jgi:hypothetical protein